MSRESVKNKLFVKVIFQTRHNTVNPNSLNMKRFADAEPERREQPSPLCVSRLEECKGVQHAIQALPELPEYVW